MARNLFGLGGPDNAQLARDLLIAEARAALAAQNAAQAENDARHERLQAEATQRKQKIRNNEYWKLRETMFGKINAVAWEAYAATILRDYLDSHNVLDPKERVETMEQAIKDYKEHLDTLNPMRFEEGVSLQIHNNRVRGIIDESVWWKPWTWHRKINLAENSVGSSRVHAYYSGVQLGLMGCGAAIAGSIVTYYTFRACLKLARGITTLKMPQLPSLRSWTSFIYNIGIRL